MDGALPFNSARPLSSIARTYPARFTACLQVRTLSCVNACSWDRLRNESGSGAETIEMTATLTGPSGTACGAGRGGTRRARRRRAPHGSAGRPARARRFVERRRASRPSGDRQDARALAAPVECSAHGRAARQRVAVSAHRTADLREHVAGDPCVALAGTRTKVSVATEKSAAPPESRAGQRVL